MCVPIYNDIMYNYIIPLYLPLRTKGGRGASVGIESKDGIDGEERGKRQVERIPQ